MLMISDKENNMIGKDYYWYQKANLLDFSKTKTVHLNVLYRNQLCALPSSFEDLQVLCPKGMEKTTNRLHLPTHPYILLKDSGKLKFVRVLPLPNKSQ